MLHKGLIMERQQSQADVAKLIADAIKQERKNLWVVTSQINNATTSHILSQVDSSVRNYMSSYILHVHPTQATQASAQEQQYQLYLTMKDNPQLQHDDILIWLTLKIKFEELHASYTPCRNSAICLRDQDDLHDGAHPEGENSAKWQKTSEHETYVFGESSSGQVNESEQGPSMSSNQEQLDDFDFWKDSCAIDEDELPTEKKGDFIFTISIKAVVQRCQKDSKAPALSLVNQDLLYLKKGNLGLEKIMLSLHKLPTVIFLDDDIEERTSRWVDKFIKTYGELGHENKFVTEIIVRRANGSIMSITEPDYKNLNKNDIEDMYLLIVNGKLGVESYQQKVNLTTPTITFPGIERYKMFSIVFEPVSDIIYKNSKKGKRVMRHQEIHKFCDATLKRVLEGLKSYNNDVKDGYVTPSLSKVDVEYLQLFEEEIEERLKHRDQMRR
nr:hypothetical protein [Tanacetum cinerariifolium]